MTSFRIQRFEQTVKENIADIIKREIKDPRIGFVTISEVKVSKDLRNATVFVSVMKEAGKAEDSVAVLHNARFFIRKFLKERMIAKYIPELHFKQDVSLDHAFKIEELIKQINKESEQKPENKE